MVCEFCLVSIDHLLGVFFFKQKTAYEMRISDWSSDVCSSDLLAQAKELLRQSEDEWRREDKAYREAQQAGRLKPQEQADYAEFVAGLRVRLLEQCEVVRAIGGTAAVSDFEGIRLGAPVRRSELMDARAIGGRVWRERGWENGENEVV